MSELKKSNLQIKLEEAIDELPIDSNRKKAAKQIFKTRDLQDTPIDYWVAMILITKYYQFWPIEMDPKAKLAKLLIECEQKARPAIPVIDKTLATLGSSSPRMRGSP